MPKDKLEVLLIEDNLSEADLVREMLSETRRLECSVMHVQRLSQGLQLLVERDFDVILVDLGLPDSQGLETALAVRSRAQRTPVVALTVLDDEETALKSLQLDIQDYLIKGEITGALLTRSLRYAIQRKSDSEALRETESRYRTLFNEIEEGFCIVEVMFDDNEKPIDYRFLQLNPTFERHTGLIDARGKTMRELAPKHEEYWFETYGRVALTGAPARFQRRAEELRRWFEVYAFRFGHPEDRQVAILFSDITHRKQAEVEILRLNAELAARAAELETANENLDAFNRTVAHDLRQPLNVVSSSCQAMEMMCGDRLPKECSAFVETAYNATRRMNWLIEALLNFSRMTQVEPRRETVDLSSMARAVAEELKQGEPGRQVEFRIADGVAAIGDATLLRLVMDNLLGNAWKYTAARERGVVEFGVTTIDGTRSYFVRDNGRGFDMTDADRIFTPFNRLPGAEGSRGFGIGLATVDRAIQRHGGKVWAAGEPDKGATFFFTLPVES